MSSGEELGILDLIVNVKLRTSTVERDKLVIYTDNKCIIKEYYEEINKVNALTKLEE